MCRVAAWTFLWLLVASGQLRAAIGCPLAVAALCRCQLLLSGLDLDCSFVNLTEVISALQSAASPIQKLVIHSTPIEALEDDAFGSLLIKQLDLSGTNLSRVSNGAFSRQADVLEQLWLANNTLSVVPSLGAMPRLQSIDLSHNLIGAVPEGVFAGLPSLRQLRLKGNRICALEANSLNETRFVLELLDLSDNCLSLVPAQNVRGSQRLAYLDLSANHIPEVLNLQFMNLPALKEVRLGDNRIVRVWPLAFMNVPELRHLDLRANRLPAIEPNAFQGFQQLEVLDLSHNLVDQLSTSSFKEVAGLKQLLLDDNRINRIDTLAFSSNPKLQLVSLQNNRISEVRRNAFDNLPQMVILLLANNSIASVGRGSLDGMPNLQQLNLRNNDVSDVQLGALDSLSRLTTLDLGENELRSLPAGVFDQLLRLFWLDLCCNRIASFPDGTFKHKIANILLHGNPLDCSEKVDAFLDYLIKNDVKTFLPEQDDVACHSPPELAGTRLKDLMIRKANETFFNAFKNLAPGGGSAAVNPLPLSNLLPSIGNIPGLSAGIPGVTSPLPDLSSLGNIPGVNLIPGGLNGLPGLSAFANGQPLQLGAAASPGSGSDLVSALNGFTDPLTRLSSNGPPLAGDVSRLVGSIPNLVSQIPANGGLDLSNVSPALIKHVLEGGSVPGISRAALDRMVQSYMQQMAAAAAAANAGATTEATTRALPPLTELPTTLVTRVLDGGTLPGLTAEQTAAITTHYLSQSTSTAPSGGGGGPKIITGIPPEQLLNGLPDDFDLSRLPAEFLQQVASGSRELDLSLLPADVIAAFKQASPDLAAQLESNGVVASGEKTTTADVFDLLPPTQQRIPPPTFSPYNINSVDRQADVRLEQEQDEQLALYTGVALAAVALLTAAVLGYFCYRRHGATKAMREQDKTRFFEPSSSSPKPMFDSISMNNNNHLTAAHRPFEPSTRPPSAWLYDGGAPRRTEM